MIDAYAKFVHDKSQHNTGVGFEPVWLPDFLMDFQRALTETAIRRGRFGLFEDCGLGKTVQEGVWGENVVRHTNKPVLALTPLAVAPQMAREFERFGIDCQVSRDGKFTGKRIIITNYQQLHKFNPDDFGGALCDESSCLKSFNAQTTAGVTEFMRRLPYRLLATATAAPNDYTELGTSSEALGYLGHMDMLAKFFKNDQNSIKAMRSRRFETGAGRDDSTKWRFKGHAEKPFWRWVCSWARAIRRPSDLGFDDSRFVLSPLREVEHIVQARTLADGILFALPAVGLKEQREERRRTVRERCERLAELASHGEQVTLWCHLNEEGDLLERLLPDAVQVSGADSDEAKEDKFAAFLNGEARALITKPKIGAWGLNMQNCHRAAAFPSHSYEQYYQLVRRHWRFGQTEPVQVDVVATEGERGVLENMRRKQLAADRMFSSLVEEMNAALHLDRNSHNFNKQTEVPQWL